MKIKWLLLILLLPVMASAQTLTSLGSIRWAVLEKMNIGQGGSGSISVAEVDSAIAVSLVRVTEDFNCYKKLDTLTTVQAQEIYWLNGDCSRVLWAKINIYDTISNNVTAISRPLKQISVDSLFMLSGGAALAEDHSEQKFFAAEDTLFYFWPDITSSLTIIVRYAARHPHVAIDSTTIYVPARLRDAVVYAAAASLEDNRQNTAGALKFEARYTDIYQKYLIRKAQEPVSEE